MVMVNAKNKMCSILLCMVTRFFQGFFNIELVFVTSQVGFKSVSDYITYTWVKDDQVSFNDELFQVCCLHFLINNFFSHNQLSRFS